MQNLSIDSEFPKKEIIDDIVEDPRPLSAAPSLKDYQNIHL
jgi:hypothetical protein